MATLPAARDHHVASTGDGARVLLHGWHLLSLDAPTVAVCWTLLFARCAGAPQPAGTSLALGCAVWLIYAADRLLDAYGAQGDYGPLPTLYRRQRLRFVVTGCVVGVALCGLLVTLPRPLLLDWLLLAVPLAAYGLAVHATGLPSRWKPWCIGMFFALAVIAPAFAERPGERLAMVCTALLFAELCRQNCCLLQGRRTRTAGALIAVALSVVLLRQAHWTTPVVLACVAAYVLLRLLARERQRLHPLTFRALADAALVAPALVWLVR